MSAVKASSAEAALRDFVAGIVREEVRRALGERQAADAGPELVTVAEAARRLSASESYVRTRIREGDLQAVHLGRAVRVRAADLARLPTRAKRQRPETPAERAARIVSGGRR